MDKTFQHKVRFLLFRLLGIGTPEEEEALEEACRKDIRLKQLSRSLADPEEYVSRQRLLQIIDSEQELRQFLKNHTLHKRRIETIYRWTAVAVLILGSSTTWLLLHPTETVTPYYVQEPVIRPAEKGAVLVLSDGSRQELLYHTNLITESDGSRIFKDSTRLNYSRITPAGENDTTPAINHLIVGRGFEYMLILQDGTKVWMNAESRLDYPVHFTNGPREVNLIGEAYFEVAKDTTRPFIVKVNNKFEVKVLGTHFNIKAYATDEQSETTLLEGKVAISTPSLKESIILSPSQQMVIRQNGESEIRKVNPEYAIAWHNGWFYFGNETLEKALEQVGRWYDIDFTFKDRECKDIRVSGKVKRFENLQMILDMLKTTTKCNYIIENQKIYITKNNRK